MPRFMLILHETPGHFQSLSPEEIQRVFEQYNAWAERLRSADRLVASDKLKEDGGKVLTAPKGKLSVVNGPYSEAKEVVGGFMMIRAADYDEAVALASDCPHLTHGRIEIRQADPQGCGGA